jgi:hypothetical protein
MLQGQGPPAREPAVSEEEKKAMMAHYFKRQVVNLNIAILRELKGLNRDVFREITIKIEGQQLRDVYPPLKLILKNDVCPCGVCRRS